MAPAVPPTDQWILPRIPNAGWFVRCASGSAGTRTTPGKEGEITWMGGAPGNPSEACAQRISISAARAMSEGLSGANWADRVTPTWERMTPAGIFSTPSRLVRLRDRFAGLAAQAGPGVPVNRSLTCGMVMTRPRLGGSKSRGIGAFRSSDKGFGPDSSK